MEQTKLGRRFEGKVCLCAASTQGLGLAIAERFAIEGGKVIVCSRSEKNVNEAVEYLKKYNVEGYVCHIGQKDQRKKMLDSIAEKHGKLDVLVCNQATQTNFGEQLKITEKSFDKLFDLNVKSIFFLIKECKELLIKGGPESNILVMSSASGIKPLRIVGVYAMTKAALINMVNWMAIELVPDNIRINCLAPGMIPTKLSTPLEPIITQHKFHNPKMFGKPEDIGGLAAAICSKDGAFLNGETVAPHGGFLGKL